MGRKSLTTTPRSTHQTFTLWGFPIGTRPNPVLKILRLMGGSGGGGRPSLSHSGQREAFIARLNGLPAVNHASSYQTSSLANVVFNDPTNLDLLSCA